MVKTNQYETRRDLAIIMQTSLLWYIMQRNNIDEMMSIL